MTEGGGGGGQEETNNAPDIGDVGDEDAEGGFHQARDCLASPTSVMGDRNGEDDAERRLLGDPRAAGTADRRLGISSVDDVGVDGR